MVLRIYGSPRSRTMRTLWMANELGLDYEHKPLEWSDPFLKSAEFLALNPAGSIPTIVDDGFALAESMAINLYLAKRYGLTRGLYPATLQGEAEVWRWCLWAQGHIEPWVQRDEAVLEVHDAAPAARSRLLEGAMTSLERALASSSWLVGGAFTVADLNVASVLSPSRVGAVRVDGFSAVADWRTRCFARPAAVETRRRYAG